jgi:TorA maturation chaperone TorD
MRSSNSLIDNSVTRQASPTDVELLAWMLQVDSALVYDEPTTSSIAGLAESGLFDEVPEEIDDPAITEGSALIKGWLSGYSDDKDAIAGLQREWLRLFVGVGEPQAPSWASYYSELDHRVYGRETLEVRKAYRKYGMEPETIHREPDDTLGLMLRFLAHLSALEVQELDPGKAQELVVEQESFLRTHILPWICRWSYLGQKYASSDFYRGAVLFTFGAIRDFARTLGFAYHDDSQSFAYRKEAQR